MRILRRLGWTLALLLVTIPGLSRAGAMPFEGTLAVVVASLPPIAVEASGTALVGGQGTSLETLELGAGLFATVVSVPVTDPLAYPLAGVLANPANGLGGFGGNPFGGLMPLSGSAVVCLFGGCDADPIANVVVPFTQGGTRGVGIGGPSIVVAGLVNVTLQGSPWTLGKVTAASASIEGFAHGPVSGGLSTAAAASGVVQLVTPIVIRTSIGASDVLPAFGILTLHFVPEPGSLLLLEVGLVGFGIQRRLARRS